jgi:hypothetical protein
LRISGTVFEFYAEPQPKFLERHLCPIDPNAVTKGPGLLGCELIGGHSLALVFKEYGSVVV